MPTAMLQVGERHIAVSLPALPPLGTRITVHRDLTEDRMGVMVEVTGHEWNLEPNAGDPVEPGGDLAELSVWIHTKKVGG